MKPEDFGITNYKIDSSGKLEAFGDVDLSNKNLTEIPFSFGMVHGSFKCTHNKLVSLKGSPIEVLGEFDATFNKINSLKYSPKIVKMNFSVRANNLKTLEDGPEYVLNYQVTKNDLESLKGICEVQEFLCVSGNPHLKVVDGDIRFRENYGLFMMANTNIFKFPQGFKNETNILTEFGYFKTVKDFERDVRIIEKKVKLKIVGVENEI